MNQSDKWQCNQSVKKRDKTCQQSLDLTNHYGSNSNISFCNTAWITCENTYFENKTKIANNVNETRRKC